MRDVGPHNRAAWPASCALPPDHIRLRWRRLPEYGCLSLRRPVQCSIEGQRRHWASSRGARNRFGEAVTADVFPSQSSG